MTSDELNQKFLHIPKFFLLASLALHGFVLVTWGTARILDDMGFHLFGLNNKKPVVKDIYQEFIQVDMVGLPDVLVNEKDTIDATLPLDEEPKQEPKPQEKEVEAPDEDSMAKLPDAADKEKESAKKAEEQKRQEEAEKRRVEREKALKELELQRRKSEREEALKALQEQQRNKLKGNILSKGTSTAGNIGTAKDLYRSVLAQRIKQHFNIYSWQEKKNLVSVIFIRIDEKGKVKEKRIVQASRDPLYDSAVLQAIEDSQPLPIPNVESILDEGVTIEFKPGQ